jgi:uncharacterized membrane protein YdjX (TVP38/TMEM64 family)
VAVDAGDRRIRRAALIRIGAAVALLFAVFVVARVTGATPSIKQLERWGNDAGALGPFLAVPVGVALNLLFVPIWLIAGAAGLVFGVAGGTAISLVVVGSSAALQLILGRRLAGREAPGALGDRGRAAAEVLGRRGFWAVFYVRLVPGIPFNTLNYAAGLSRLRVRDIFAGTLLGFAPRTFAYAALGGNIANLGSTQAKAALAFGVLVAVAGALVARRQLAAERRSRGEDT